MSTTDDTFAESQAAVNNPAHYTTGAVECIDAIEAAGYGVDFCAGCAIKYLWRLKHKGSALDDARKARWYVDRLIQQLEAKHTEETP